jgi:hypothetical protein
VNSKFQHPIAHRLAVSEIAGLQMTKTNSYPRLRSLVANGLQPFRDRLPAILTLVSKKLDHGMIVA